MFQFGFSIANECAQWYASIEEVFTIKIKNAGGIIASVQKNDRTFVSIACESVQRNRILRDMRSCFIDMYATTVKYEFLKEAIRLPLDRPSYNLLLHTLVAFDRETERELIQAAMPMRDGISLDGIFYFRMQELQARWREIGDLAMDNALYLIDEDTLNELIRFLISAVNPKIMRLDVRQQDNRYNVVGHLQESRFEYSIIGTEQLLLYLVDIAPLELRLSGHFTDKRLCDRLVRIFDAKREEPCEVCEHR